MTIFIRIFILSSVLLFLSNCKDSVKSTSVANKLKEQPNTLYPSIDTSTMINLYNSVDLIDIMFHELPVSMSYDNEGGIRSSLSQISTQPAKINSNCKPMGHIYYGSEGQHIMEADLYYSEQCKYFVFLKNGKPIFANEMSANGIQWFEKIINQVKGQ